MIDFLGSPVFTDALVLILVAVPPPPTEAVLIKGSLPSILAPEYKGSVLE